MRRMYGCFAGLLMLLEFTGCKSTPIRTRVVTEPPGARVEVNGNYVGPAPVEVTLPQSGSSHKLKGRALILAFPSAPDQKVQQMVLRNHQLVPEHVVLDMSFDREAAMSLSVESNPPPAEVTSPAQ